MLKYHLFIFFLQFHGITIQNIPGTKRIRVYDCHGIIPRPKSDLHKKENRYQAYVEDLKKGIDGHIIEGYEVSFCYV